MVTRTISIVRMEDHTATVIRNQIVLLLNGHWGPADVDFGSRFVSWHGPDREIYCELRAFLIRDIVTFQLRAMRTILASLL